MKFSYTQILECADEIKLVASKMQLILEQISDISGKLNTHENWQGPASDYYSKQLYKLSNTFDDVIAGVNRSGEFLKENAQYRKILESQINESSSLQIQGGGQANGV